MLIFQNVIFKHNLIDIRIYQFKGNIHNMLPRVLYQIYKKLDSSSFDRFLIMYHIVMCKKQKILSNLLLFLIILLQLTISNLR